MKEKVKKLAKEWQLEIEKDVSLPGGFVSKIDKLIKNPKNKIFLIELLDQSFRGNSYSRTDNQIRYIINKYNFDKLMVPDNLFSTVEQFLVLAYYYFGWILPFVSVPIFAEKVRMDSSSFVVSYERLQKFMKKRMHEGVHVNINKIGESVIGQEEANERMEKYIDIMKNSPIGHIAVKISTIYSQVSSIGIEDSVAELVKRLSELYEVTSQSYYTDEKGNKYKKWIHLDMEEYRDLEITYEAFVQTLSQEKFKHFGQAGIALQAYLPDTLHYYKKLLAFAKKRVESGGSPLKIRLVKGANMEMEMTEASMRGWELVTYSKKVDTDSNFKIILQEALKRENAQYLHVGIGSHNLFDVAYAYTIVKQESSDKYVFFEMLEGMATGLRNQLLKANQTVLLYVPVADRKGFTSAIGYLVRRLDENTSKDNFMRYAFGLKVDSEEYRMLENKFEESIDGMPSLFLGRNRKQNRLTEEWKEERAPWSTYQYHSEADTDFALPENREWAQNIINKWKNTSQNKIPLVINGKVISEPEGRSQKKLYDWSQKDKKEEIATYIEANEADLKKAFETANKDEDQWSKKSFDEIYSIMSKAANICRKKRADLIGIAAAELGKVFTETDVEVSEAVDFINFYSKAICDHNAKETISIKPKGTLVVISPWNFPIAIPIGGIVAALVTGNRVIFKPSSDSVFTGYEIAKIFWEAGVSKKTLQFVPSQGINFGKAVSDKNHQVDAVIFTGGEEAAYRLLEGKNNLYLAAETGGKNASIISSMADVDSAIMSVITSAFSNSGQKCSASSLLLLERKLYESEKVKKLILDAILSIKVGSPWNLANKISRLGKKLSGNLKTALNKLEEHEKWWIPPSYADGNEWMLKPCVRYGTKVEDFTYKNELFGPHLSIMVYDKLDEAIDIANNTGYGLTGGFYSLDEREKQLYMDKIEVGNLYINRGTTGAIVLRQPFGGMKKSAIGAGRKVGHWNYLTQFVSIEDSNSYYEKLMKKDFKELNLMNIGEEGEFLNQLYQEISFEDESYINDLKKVAIGLKSYTDAYKDKFSVYKDYVNVRGEDNLFGYVAVKNILYHVHKQDPLKDVLLILLGALIVKTKIYLSIKSLELNKYIEFILRHQDSLGFEVVVENDEELSEKLINYERIRYTNRNNIPEIIWKKAAEHAQFIVTSKPLLEGSYELLHYVKERSISHSYHRYGNLGARGINKK